MDSVTPTDDLARDCLDLAGEVNKLYQRMNLAGKNAAVDRLRRKVNRLAELTDRALHPEHLEEALQTLHECVPLMDLNVKSLLLSPDLQKRWNHRLAKIQKRLEEQRNMRPSRKHTFPR